MAETRYAVCNLCDAICGLAIEVDGRRILSIRGDEHDRFSRGHICPKGTAHKDVYEDPDRLRLPVRRVGTRWEETSWPNAIAEVSRRVVAIHREYGRDALGIYYGNPVGHSYQTMLAVLAFVKLAGTRNVFSSSSVDAHPRMLVSRLLYGNQALLPVPDIERTDLLVVMGANPIVSNGSVMSAPDVKSRLRAIRDRGGRIIVIDPRHTETAAVADEHHFIRPGTDALMLLAVLHVLYAERRTADAMRATVRGLDELARIAQRYPPEVVASAVGIDASTIRGLARSFADAQRAVWYGRMGTCTQEFGCLSTWLIDAINIVTGNFDRPGGAMFPTPAADLARLARRIGEPGQFDRWRSRVAGLPEFNGEFPVAGLADEIETPGDGQIKALITIAGNPVLSNPNGRRLDRALERLEFQVAVDFYVNETTRHADIVLPPATMLEGDHYPLLEHAMAVRNTAHYAAAVLPRDPDARADWEILIDLMRGISRERGGTRRILGPGAGLLGWAIRSGRILDLMLRTGPQRLSLARLKAAPHGIDLGALEPRGRKAIQTASGRIDLVPERLVADLQRLDRRLARGTEVMDGDLLLVSRRTLRSMNSWLNNVLRLARGRDRCVLQMHPADAEARQLGRAERVRVRSRTGEIEVALERTTRVMPGVVSLPYGWGHDRPGVRLAVARRHAGSSMNDVSDERLYDEVTGTTVLDGIPVTVTGTDPS